MSVDIIINHDPAGISARDLRKVESGTVLLDWLIGEYGAQGFTVPTKIFLNGIHAAHEIDVGSYEALSQELKDGDIVDIIHQPLGIELLIGLAVGLISVVATILLAPDIAPPPSGEGSRANESPNNRLSGQTNISRLGGRLPDIYGRNRVYPDLGVETATEFKSHIKFVTEWLIVGEGFHLLEQIKSGETLISDIKGSSLEIFLPGDVIPELINPTTSNEVNGQEIEGPNDTTGLNVTIIKPQFTTNTVRTFDTAGSAFQSLTFGDTFIISGSTSNNGEFTFNRLDAQIDPPEDPGETTLIQWILTVDETFVVETDTLNVNFATDERKDVIGPFTVPGKTDEVQFDITAPRGLIDRREPDAVAVKITFELILDEVDILGEIVSTEKTIATISDSTLDARFYTFRVPTLNPGAPYQASIKRLTNTIDDANYLDVTKWAKLAGLSRLLNFTPPNVTSVLLTTEATEQAVKSQERRFNLIQSRRLRSFDLDTETILSGLNPTARVADALFEHLTSPSHGNKSASSIDLVGLYTIQEQLDNDPIYGRLLGRFSYTFSTPTSSAKDEFMLMANACRLFINRIGDKITFGRDEVRVNRTKLFNGRIKKPKSEKKTIRFQKPTDQDGIELQWTHEDSGDTFTVIFPETGPAPINTKKIDAAGIKNFKQAWNRAKIEFAKLKLQRETVEFESTKEGLLSPIGDRVANVDGTDIVAQGGEIKAITSLTVTSSEIIDFKGQPDAQVILRSESGEVEEFTVTARTDGVNGFILPSLPTFTIRIRGDLNYQVGTLYTFAPQGAGRVRDYVIQQMSPTDNGYVKLNLINYDAAIWAADTQIPPSHETTERLALLLVTVPSGSLFDPVTVTLSDLKTVDLVTVPSGSLFDPFIVSTLTGEQVGLVTVPSGSLFDPLIVSLSGTSQLVTLVTVPSGSQFDPMIVTLSASGTETLAWNLEPTGVYDSMSIFELATEKFIVDSLGAWTVSGVSNVFSQTDSGFYRPQVVGDDKINYEIKITATINSGAGTISLLGGVVLGTFVNLTGGQGVEVSDAVAGSTNFSITVEIRDKALAANSTGLASFNFDVDGQPPP